MDRECDAVLTTLERERDIVLLAQDPIRTILNKNKREDGMKNTERPRWMAPSRRATQQTPPKAPAQGPSSAPRAGGPAKGSSRGYNPYDTVTTRLPDVWHSKPKRS